MPTLNVTVALTPAYNSAYQQLVVINATHINLSIDIQDGTHTFTSAFQQVGALKYFAVPRLEAAIRMTYSYNAADGTLELFGNDFVSASQSTCLLTRPVGSDQVCQQHTYPGDSCPCGANPNWTYSTSYTPGLADALSASIRSANDAIIAAAKQAFPVVRVNTPPPPLETAEDMNKWMSMYAPDGTHLGSFDPTREYPLGTVMVNHIQSVWGGTVEFVQNEFIANVIGSSSDPKLPGSKPWIEVWERQFGMESYCTSHNWASGQGFVCNDGDQANRIGGHVIIGTVARTMPTGSNNVYIIPICKAHNGDDSVYMRANVYRQGIWLKNYQQR